MCGDGERASGVSGWARVESTAEHIQPEDQGVAHGSRPGARCGAASLPVRGDRKQGVDRVLVDGRVPARAQQRPRVGVRRGAGLVDDAGWDGAGAEPGGGAAVRRGDWIYVVAGNRGGHGAHAQALPWMDAYNWRTGKWSRPGQFPDMPDGGRDHVGGALVNDELCVAGGRDGGTKKFFDAVIRTTFCYSFKSGKWSHRGNFPQPRAGAMTGLTCDGKMMIAGGESYGRAYDRVDVFDGRKWTRAPNLARARHGSGLAFAECNRCAHIFIASGSGNQGGGPELLSTEQFVPKGAPDECGKY